MVYSPLEVPPQTALSDSENESTDLKSVRRLYDKYVPKGSLPAVPKNMPRVVEGEDVENVRRNFVNYFWEMTPDLINPDYVEQMTSNDQLGLLLYFYNRPASIEHFISLSRFVKDEDLKKRITQLTSIDDIEEADEIYDLYAQYLFAKLPRKQRELIEKKEEQENLEKLVSYHEYRNKHNMIPLLGFHVSPIEIEGDSVNQGATSGQTNIDMFTKERVELPPGTKFFTLSPYKLYYTTQVDMRFVTIVDVTLKDMERMYDDKTCCYSFAGLDISHPNLKNLSVDTDVQDDFGFQFGAL